MMRCVYYDKLGTGASSFTTGEDGCSADEGNTSAAHFESVPGRDPHRADDPDRCDATGNQCQTVKVNMVLENSLIDGDQSHKRQVRNRQCVEKRSVLL